MKIKSQKDFFSGLLYTLVGAAFAYGATSYNIGTGARMGPGYFPLLLGSILAIIGASIALVWFDTTVSSRLAERLGGRSLQLHAPLFAERAEQRDMLISLGCLTWQGYLFGRPGPAEALQAAAAAHAVVP